MSRKEDLVVHISIPTLHVDIIIIEDSNCSKRSAGRWVQKKDKLEMLQ